MLGRSTPGIVVQGIRQAAIELLVLPMSILRLVLLLVNRKLATVNGLGGILPRQIIKLPRLTAISVPSRVTFRICGAKPRPEPGNTRTL